MGPRDKSHHDVFAARGIVSFFGRLILVYTVCMLLWMLCGSGYRQMLSSAGNAVFAMGRANDTVTFLNVSETQTREHGLHRDVDLVVLVRPQSGGTDVKLTGEQSLLARSLITMTYPYSANAFVVALIFSMQVAWKEYLRSFFILTTGLYLWFFACIAVDIEFALSSFPERAREMPRWLLESVAVSHASVTNWPAGVFIVPLLLWILFCLPRYRIGLKPRFD